MSARKKLPIPMVAAGFCEEMGFTPESRARWYREMQEKQPIRYCDDPGYWEVFRYEDVERVLTDHTAFSVEYIRFEGLPDVDDMGNTDPPRHRQLRNMVSQAFTPRRIAELAPRIHAIADDLLDQVLADGAMDFAQQFAYIFPVQVVAEMLEIPTEDKEHFRRWSYQLVGILPHPDDPSHSELGAYMSAQLAQRAKNPGDDLVSALLQASVDGEQMSHEQVLTICEILLLAGNVTTTNLLNHTIYRLNKQPEIFPELRNDPSLIPGTLEEVMRYELSVSGLMRLVKQKTTLLGQEIKEGEIVLAHMGAANFDRNYFAHPERFDIRRSPNPHLSFGHGVHFCLGAPLARLEGKIAMERLVARMQDIRTDPDKPIEYLDPRVGIISRLPILFSPVA